MKAFTKTITAAVISLSAIAGAHATEVVPADNTITSKICATAAAGNKFKMNSVIKNSHLNKQFIVENVTCNNQNILSFVAKHGTDSDEMIDLLSPATQEQNVTITDLARVSKI